MWPVHWQEHGRPRLFQAVTQCHKRLFRRHGHVRRRLPLDPLVRLVWILRDGLAVLETTKQPDEEAEKDKRCETWDEGQTLDVQAWPHIAAVEEHVVLQVAEVGGRIDISGAPLVGERAVVEVPECFWLLHSVDFLPRPHILTVFIGFVEDLVLPHVEIQNQHQEDDPVVEPLTCKETRDCY